MSPQIVLLSFPTDDDWRFLHAVGVLAVSNPFSPARIAAERLVLGADFSCSGAVWCRRGDLVVSSDNIARIAVRLRAALDRVQAWITLGGRPSDAQRTLYLEACFYYLFDSHDARFQPFIDGRVDGSVIAALYGEFKKEYSRLLVFSELDLRPPRCAHMFACCYQIRRAFHYIFWCVIGGSAPAAALRAAIWQAIFTHDLRRYTRSCDRRRMDVSTLIIGDTGTGKELVAQAIGNSSFVPFDEPNLRFTIGPGEGFHAVNLSALSDSLFEAELFGHERGAFTGAIKARQGLLEACGDGVLLFDEIGELTLPRQVTLLRVLEARTFQRVGDTEEQVLSARILAATHRDLADSIAKGTFRLDLYERLAGIRITTPTLWQQLQAAPGERRELARHFSARWVEPDEIEALTDEVETFIETYLPDYPWPGNMRELKRCVESVYATKGFMPLDPTAVKRPAPEDDDPLRSVRALELTEEGVRNRYASLVFEQKGERQDETAQVLGINRKTVAARLDHAWLARRAKRRLR